MLLAALALALAAPASPPAPPEATPDLHTGDVVLIASTSPQASAIARATRSKYTHAGVVVVEDGTPWVYEAAGTVRRTPFASFAKRAVPGTLLVRRAGVGITPAQQARIAQEARRLVGRPYDLAFAQGDDALYCSEYVRLVLAVGGVDAGKIQHVRDLDVDDPVVHALIAQRWRRHPACRGAATLAACMTKLLDAEIVTPASLATDARFVDVEH